MSTEQLQRSELRSRIQQRLQQRTDTTTKSSPKTFGELPTFLQNVLPDNYTYIIKSYKELELLTFDGAPNASFDSSFYINISTQEGIEAWRTAFHKKTGTIFRITRADKVKGIKVIYHKDFHCRHADIAAIKYMQKTYAQKAGQRRSRNTNCQCLAKIRLEKSRLLLSHPCEVRLLYNHNHKLEPAQSSDTNNITTTTLNSHITLASSPFLHETLPSVVPSIGTTPLGTPLIGTPSDTSTISAQSSPKQEFADFGYSTLNQFTRETEADILIEDPYYNTSLYKFFITQNKARSHSLDTAARFFDSFPYVQAAYDEYPGADMGINLFNDDYLGIQYQLPQQQQQLDQKTYQSYDFCDSNTILDQQYRNDQHTSQSDQQFSQSSDPFASSTISRKRKSFELGGSYFDMLPRRKRDCLMGTERASQLNVTSENDQGNIVDRLGLEILRGGM